MQTTLLLSGMLCLAPGAWGQGVVTFDNPDGSLDTTFMDGVTGANDQVYALATQSDGKALVAGKFGGVNGVPATGLVRL